MSIQPYDGRAFLVQAGRRFEVFCSLSGGRGTFNPADGADAPALGPAVLELPGGSTRTVEVSSVELVEPRFGELRLTERES